MSTSGPHTRNSSRAIIKLYFYSDWRSPLKEKPTTEIGPCLLTKEHKDIIRDTWDKFIKDELTIYGVKIFQQVMYIHTLYTKHVPEYVL